MQTVRSTVLVRLLVVAMLAILFLTGTFVTGRSEAQTAPILRFIGFSPATPPADSLAFRQAIAQAVDREAVS